MMGARIFVGATLILAAAGCGGGPPPTPAGVEIGGKVLLPSGTPLKGGTLVLRPVGGIHGASAQIQKDGGFSLTDPAGKNSVVPGKYQVYVLLNDPSLKTHRSSINKKYQESEDGDSDIFLDIQDSKKDLVIRLKK